MFIISIILMPRVLCFCTLFVLSLFLPAKQVSTLPFESVVIHGELKQRIERNFERLHQEKYQPHKVFLTMKQSGDWPGDTEGRTILGLVLEAQALHKEPLYLNEIMRQLPSHLNEQGYVGPVFKDYVHEQQLSGNGWMLRGLCEYYLWKQDSSVLRIIQSISRNLFLSAKGKYASYPRIPEQRLQNVGAESGNISQTINGWKLSTDIGCVFIGLDGLVQAYGILKDKELKPVIEEMINCFLQIDLVEIKAQTHASLTACRALLRYAEIIGNKHLICEVEKRYQLYLNNGMTENYENYNWFDRYDTWTEPCAIVDSYMLAVQLWQHTGNVQYLQIAEQIYYNALCHTQRFNGGFGCDNCPGISSDTPSLTVHTNEAHWCCTMRGAEGLARVASHSVFIKAKEIYVPFYRNCTFTTSQFQIEEETSYPFSPSIRFVVMKGEGTLDLFLPNYYWMEDVKVLKNGQPIFCRKKNGFLHLYTQVKEGNTITVSFGMKLDFRTTINHKNTSPYQRTAFYGPLQLGYRGNSTLKFLPAMKLEMRPDSNIYIQGTPIMLTPVYHLMDSTVWKTEHSSLQVLF